MAQPTVHDCLASDADIVHHSVKRICDTIVETLKYVDKKDTGACTAAAEGALTRRTQIQEFRT